MAGEVIDTEAVRCPVCEQPPFSRCVYVMPSTIDVSFGDHYLSPRQREIVARVGKPTKRHHWARIDAARRRYMVKVRRGVRAREAARTRKRRVIAAALRDFDLAEHDRLRAWLAVHAGIFEEETV